MDINKTPCKDMYVGHFLKGKYFGFNDRYNDPGKYAISYCENTASYGLVILLVSSVKIKLYLF